MLQLTENLLTLIGLAGFAGLWVAKAGAAYTGPALAKTMRNLDHMDRKVC